MKRYLNTLFVTTQDTWLMRGAITHQAAAR